MTRTALALALTLIGALLGPPAARAADAGRPTISVLYFENRTGKADYDVLRKGLADMIVTDLTAWDGVTVVERERLEAVLTELKLQQTKAFDAKKRQKIGQLLGAQYVLVGAMNLGGATLAIDAQLVEVQTGAVRAAARSSGSPDKIFDLEQSLVVKITAAIDARLKNPALRRTVNPPSIKTLLDYSKALDLADKGKLAEAHAAMRLVVSSAPTFLLARDRRERILKQVEESQKRRQENVSTSVVALVKVVDDALKHERLFARMEPAAQGKFLAFRWLRVHLLGRLLRQHLSTRDSYLKVIRRGQEAAALRMMRTIADNLRRLREELRLTGQKDAFAFGYGTPNLGDDVNRLVQDAGFGRLAFPHDVVHTLTQFVLQGRVVDGEHGYTMAPALGDVDPKEQKAAFELLDRAVTAALAEHAKAQVAQQRQHESRATQYLEEKANALMRLDQDEAAAAAYQKILDAFPHGYRAPWVEGRIKQIAGASHDHERSVRERWAKALQGCADMDIRVGEGTLHRKLRRMGLLALAAQAGELEKACKPTAKNRSAFAYVYNSLARTAVTHEDCAAYRFWTRKFLEANGSVSDMQAYHQRTPWCDLGDVAKGVTWLHARLDGHWSVEFDRHLTSVRSHDQKVLSLFGRREGQNTQLSLYLDLSGPETFTCRKAQWRALGGANREGTCTVQITKLARERGEFDEGTFSAQFEETTPAGHKRLIKMTKGTFRLRRQ
jgi:TolB-like protein